MGEYMCVNQSGCTNKSNPHGYGLGGCKYRNRSEAERLNSFAEKYCIEIFELFDELEMHEQLAPIRSAWHTGRELSALNSECT